MPNVHAICFGRFIGTDNVYVVILSISLLSCKLAINFNYVYTYYFTADRWASYYPVKVQLGLNSSTVS